MTCSLPVPRWTREVIIRRFDETDLTKLQGQSPFLKERPAAGTAYPSTSSMLLLSTASRTVSTKHGSRNGTSQRCSHLQASAFHFVWNTLIWFVTSMMTNVILHSVEHAIREECPVHWQELSVVVPVFNKRPGKTFMNGTVLMGPSFFPEARFIYCNEEDLMYSLYVYHAPMKTLSFISLWNVFTDIIDRPLVFSS